MTTDRPVLGILLMLGFCIFAPLGDALVKALGTVVPVLMILLVRYGMQSLIAIFVLISGGSLYLPRRVFMFTVLRSILHVSAFAIFVVALRYLPLADAIAIAYVMPFILLILGGFFLGEEVGPRRIAACGVGFIGTILVVQPSFAEVGLPALLPIVVAVLFAVFMLLTRQIAKESGPFKLQAISGLVSFGVLLAVWALPFNSDQIKVIYPTEKQLTLLVLSAVLGTIAHLFITWSLRFAPSATLAPMQYLEIPFATLIGWLVFHDLPNGLAAVGIVVTIGAGLYVLWREHQTSKSHSR